MEIIKTEKLRKEYGELVAVNDLSFSVDKGQVLGLIGPNGAGKTTLLKMLSSLLRPTSGNVNVMGMNLTEDYLKIRGRIGFLPDFFNLYNDLTLEECLKFFASAYNVESSEIPKNIDRVLKYIGLEDKRKDLIKNLSRGMVQRLGVGVSLVHNPELFLLDEPASGLDPKARIRLREILRKLAVEGKTIIISSHILTELSGFCTHIAIMNKGKLVVHGEVNEIQNKLTATHSVSVKVVDRAEEAASLIGEFEDSKNITMSGNTIVFETAKETDDLWEINNRLVQSGIKVIGLSEEKTNLEDLFMQISAQNEGPE